MKHAGYDRKVLITFDIVGSYFIDFFYNDLFLKAKELHRVGKSKSITDAYRNCIVWYMKGIADTPKTYIDVMKKLSAYYLREYYKNAAQATIATLPEFENRILSQFVPPEYFADFTSADKENVLHEIIIRAVNSLGEIVLGTEMLGRIIDDHLNGLNIQSLQEQMVNVLVDLREGYYSKFVSDVSKSNGNKTVSIDQFKKLKAAYAAEVSTRVNLETERDKVIHLLNAALQKINSLEGELATLKAKTAETAIMPQPSNRNSPGSIATQSGLTMSALMTRSSPQRVTLVEDSTAITLPPLPPPVAVTVGKLPFENAIEDDIRSHVAAAVADLGPPKRTRGKKTAPVTPAPVPKPVVSATATPAPVESSESEGESEAESDSSAESGDDSAEVRRKRQEGIKARLNATAVITDDDPGFGN